MESILTTPKSLYVNNDAGAPRKSSVDHSDSDTFEQQTRKQILKTGSLHAMEEAEAIFSRANSYADVSAKVQKSLLAYEAVEASLKREAVSQLMGVDLYA